jgi:P27 family predicted phage terminase small subunit
LTAEGKRAWRRLAGQLEAAGIVQQVDADLLAAYCEQIGEVERLSKAVKKHGDDAGLLRSRRQAIEAAYKIGQQFGFTPASRSRVTGSTERATDDSRNGKPFPCGL